MISILIPTYNYDCSALVVELKRQAYTIGVEYEIIVMDDCSTKELKGLKMFEGEDRVRVIKLSENVGRAAVRNYLAEEAQYCSLLFLDSDSMPADAEFLQRYVERIPAGKIYLGGRVYLELQDDDHTLLPRYGQAERNYGLGEEPSRAPFTTPNFLIPKAEFAKVRFDETIVDYGHEDTIFGIELSRLGIDYYRIDNPVVHLDIEANKVYLEKTRYAVEHILRLKRGGNYAELDDISSLLRMYNKVKRFGMIGILAKIYKYFGSYIEAKLCSRQANMTMFSVYKLLYICHISRIN